MSLLKTLAAIGQNARQTLVKSSYQTAEVVFAIPLEVVKITKQPPTPPVYAKLGRKLINALNGAYQGVLRTQIESAGELTAKQIFTSTSEGVSVVITGSMEIKEIGTSDTIADKTMGQAFLRDVVIACNAGYLRTQAKAAKLSEGLKEV